MKTEAMTDLPAVLDIPVRLPWRVICQLACQSLCTGIEFNAMIEFYLRQAFAADLKKKGRK